MKIIRRGTRADNGPSSIELNNLKISLDKEGIIIRDSGIRDFVTKSHHNYEIIISLEEIGAILDSLGTFPDERNNEIGKAFESRLKKLLRIVQSCINT